MLAVKGGVRNLNVAGFFHAGQKTLRQRRTLIRKRIFCRDDCQISLRAALGDELLGRLSSTQPPTQDDDWKIFHAVGAKLRFPCSIGYLPAQLPGPRL